MMQTVTTIEFDDRDIQELQNIYDEDSVKDVIRHYAYDQYPTLEMGMDRIDSITHRSITIKPMP